VGYVVLTGLTDAVFMGDTVDYVSSALRGPAHPYFWEFGHLLWRPFGWVLFQALAPLASWIGVHDPRLLMTAALLGTSWLCGFVLTAWDAGGEVWISRRVEVRAPRPEWGWVEGDDRRIAWLQLHGFFHALELGRKGILRRAAR